MPLLLPRRLRRAEAELAIDAECKAPPDEKSGGVARVRVLLRPWEPLTISRGWLELLLVTTRFSRTVLDGYLEHSAERRLRMVGLCGRSEAASGAELEWSADVPISFDSPGEGRPARVQCKFLARFDVKGCRELQAAAFVSPPGHAGQQGPVVDGTGFLPLYEFRSK